MNYQNTAIVGSNPCWATPASQRPENIVGGSGASEVMEIARAVAAQANSVAADVENRLSVVMHPAPPDTPVNVEPLSSIAPLFADLRGQLFDIRNALYGISRMVGRLDL